MSRIQDSRPDPRCCELTEQLDKVFHPRSVAVAGVSSRVDSPGTLALRSLLGMGFEGSLYPVNPKYDEILGLKCYPDIGNLPAPVDMVLLSIPPGAVPAMLAECVRAGVAVCVINTAGFSETGRAEGSALEEKMRQAVAGSDTRLVGPNCMGVFSSAGRLALFDGQRPGDGRVSLISQSGSFCSFLYMLGAERAVLFSKMVSSGNELDLNCADYLEYLAGDPATEIVVSYLEEVRDPRRFLDVATGMRGSKPFLVFKAGLTDSGRRTASSHTGAMSGSGEIWHAAARQAGIIEVDDLTDTVDTLAAFYHLRQPRGRRLCVISPPGGIAVNAADAVERSGLELGALQSDTVKRLDDILPREGTSLANPVDMGFGAVVPGNLLEVTLAVATDPGVDIIMVVAGAPAAREGDPGLVRMHAAEIREAAGQIDKPIVVIGIPSGMAFPYMAELHWAGIPCYLSPAAACRALARLLDYHGV